MKPERIDPALLSALADADAGGEEALARHTRSLGIRAARGPQRPATVVVFVHCDEQVSFAHLVREGIVVNQQRGRVRTAKLPLNKLADLSEQPGVVRIIAARYLRARMDAAARRVKLPGFVRRTGLTGRDVVIGIVDTGIDALHPSFTGRILRIWDQTARGAGVAGAAYGSELLGEQLAASRDTDGHGTHVAGIAAGSAGLYGGVAPAADMVIVKTDFQDAHIADAIQYVFRVAAAMGRPAVVNLSLSGHADAHDGSDSLSLIIDSESGPGRIVCCAAGNEGNDNIHGAAVIPAGRTHRMRFRVPPAVVGIGSLYGWYEAGAALELALRSPGRYVTPYQVVLTPASPNRNYTLPDARIRMTTPGLDPANGDNTFLLQLRGPAPASPVASGVWQLLARNASASRATLNVWSVDDQNAGNVVFSGKSVSDRLKIGSPGSAAQAITVAAFTTKDSWTDSAGRIQSVGLTLHDIADFSNEGPLRGGARKPDVAAPGAMIASALSRHAAVEPADVVAADFVVMSGTSMAAPFVSGLVALLLERDPALDPAQVKAALRRASARPRVRRGTFHPKWGYGLVDASRL